MDDDSRGLWSSSNPQVKAALSDVFFFFKEELNSSIIQQSSV